MMEAQSTQLFLNQITPHRKRIKTILFFCTLISLVIVALAPIPQIANHRIILFITLGVELLYHFFYWNILSPYFKTKWTILAAVIVYNFFYVVAAFYSEGLLIFLPLILLISTMVVFDNKQLLIFTVSQFLIVIFLLLVELSGNNLSEQWFHGAVLIGMSIFIVGMIAGITSFEVEEREERMVHLEELDKIKNTFIAAVTHNLRAPLTAILSYLQILMSESTKGQTEQHFSKQQQEILTQISLSAHQLSELVDDIINTAALDSHKIVLNLESISLNGLVREVAQNFKGQSERKGIPIIVPSEEAQEVIVGSDRKQLGIVFSNLIDNALKFTQKGYVNISFERHLEGALIKVSDTGRGIPREFQNQLFSPFSRTDGEEGAGLGLYTVKSIIEAHQGKIWVESTVDKGTTFIILLPYLQKTA